MATSLRQWESDPFFSAAEVVQDSADRMESTFRHLLHEQALAEETFQHTTVHPSIEQTVRDLKTTLETTKWQLQDFERAVNLAAVTERSGLRADIISRHEQFVRAISEQILDVEKYLGNILVKKTFKSTDLVNLNEQENDRLALFLSGGNHSETMPQSDLEESSILRRFLDPTTQCGFSTSSNEIVEHSPQEIKNSSTNIHAPLAHDSFFMQSNGLRKVGSSLQVGQEAQLNLDNSASGYSREDGGWDLESSQDKSHSFKQRKLKNGHYRKNMFCIFGSSWCANTDRIYRSLMKRWKDGEERQHSSSYANILQAEQEGPGLRSSSWSGPLEVPSRELYSRSICLCQWLRRISYKRSLHYMLARRRTVLLVMVILGIFVILAILVSLVA